MSSKVVIGILTLPYSFVKLVIAGKIYMYYLGLVHLVVQLKAKFMYQGPMRIV